MSEFDPGALSHKLDEALSLCESIEVTRRTVYEIREIIWDAKIELDKEEKRRDSADDD